VSVCASDALQEKVSEAAREGAGLHLVAVRKHRDGRVRCSKWLGGSNLISLELSAFSAPGNCPDGDLSTAEKETRSFS